MAKGIRDKLPQLIPVDVTSLQEAVASDFKVLQTVEAQIAAIEEQVQSKIDTIVGDFDTKMGKLREFADDAKQYGSYIKWAMIAVQCGTPPGWGCLKLLAKRLVAEAVDEILSWCSVQAKFTDLVLATGWFDDIPKTVAENVAARVEELLPTGVVPIFDRGVFSSAKAPTAESIPCAEQPSAQAIAMTDLKEQVESKLGPDVFEALTEAMDKFGVPLNEEISVEQIQQLRDDLLSSGITAEVLREYIHNTEKPAKAKRVSISEFLERVKTAVRERRITEIQSALKGGKFDQLFNELKPGESRVRGLTKDEIKSGRALSKRIVRKGIQEEPEKQIGVVDVSFNPDAVNCTTGAFSITYHKVTLQDIEGNQVKVGLEGTTREAHFRIGAWKKILCE